MKFDDFDFDCLNLRLFISLLNFDGSSVLRVLLAYSYSTEYVWYT